MAVSELRLIKHCVEYIKRSKKNIEDIPRKIRGIYVLYKKRPNKVKPKGGDAYDVAYIGMAGGEKQAGVGGRLRSHNKRKEGWTHFSVFEVWDNIREEEVRELEGILRHIFRNDSHANKLGIQRSFKKLTRVRKDTKSKGKLTKQSTPTKAGK
jgi:hypothetical protein